jgi:hypothetical protein
MEGGSDRGRERWRDGERNRGTGGGRDRRRIRVITMHQVTPGIPVIKVDGDLSDNYS